MQNSASGKLLAALMVLIAVLAIALHFLNRTGPDSSAPVLEPADSIAKDTFHFRAPPVPRPHPQPDVDVAGLPKIPREKVEEWLAKHNRDAMSLLAAFRALGDTNYLNEAATNFPNNPQVELAVLAHNEFPQDRRKWLDLFKNSSPSNSLANYLSAQDYFKNGNTDAAVQELAAASGKSQFDGFQTESRLDEEDLYLSSGYSQLESSEESMAGMAQDDLPELATLKRLAQGIADLQKQEINSGDANSAANLAEMGINFGNQISSGDSGKYLINQLVGIAVESIILQQLDQNTAYDFLDGKTPSQVVQENRQQRKSVLSPIAQSYEAIEPYLSESEMMGYQERVKIYGELPAMQWVIQQHPPILRNTAINSFAPLRLCVKINRASAISPRSRRQRQNFPLPCRNPRRTCKKSRRRTADFPRAQTGHVPTRTTICLPQLFSGRLHAPANFFLRASCTFHF